MATVKIDQANTLAALNNLFSNVNGPDWAGSEFLYNTTLSDGSSLFVGSDNWSGILNNAATARDAASVKTKTSAFLLGDNVSVIAKKVDSIKPYPFSNGAEAQSLLDEIPRPIGLGSSLYPRGVTHYGDRVFITCISYSGDTAKKPYLATYVRSEGLWPLLYDIKPLPVIIDPASVNENEIIYAYSPQAEADGYLYVFGKNPQSTGIFHAPRKVFLARISIGLSLGTVQWEYFHNETGWSTTIHSPSEDGINYSNNKSKGMPTFFKIGNYWNSISHTDPESYSARSFVFSRSRSITGPYKPYYTTPDITYVPDNATSSLSTEAVYYPMFSVSEGKGIAAWNWKTTDTLGKANPTYQRPHFFEFPLDPLDYL